MKRASVKETATYVLLLLVAFESSNGIALPDDRRQAIEISANRAVRDDKAGHTIYSGNVVLEQGSLQIEADRLTIFHEKDAADRIVAIGEPAKLRQQPELDEEFVRASAGRIVYEKSRERVLLRYAAIIEQDGAVVSGESIEYFLAEQRVSADASLEDESARVQVIIPAEVVESDNSEGEPLEDTPDSVPEERTTPLATNPDSSQNPVAAESGDGP
ncbi:MAG: lipopolysaccharide transport periplasmic protein LptA [Pseudomonadota bacterium]